MKRLTSLAALFIVLGCLAHSSVSSQEKKPESQATGTPAGTESSLQAQAMKGLRDRLLTSSPEDVGLTGKDAKAKVWGILMEVTFPRGTATIVSVRDGTASLYTSTGGGVFGGYVAQEKARRFVAEAEKHLANMKAVKSFPYPEVGHLKFYALTPDGVYTVEADEKEVIRAQHPLFPLFLAGNEVMTALRTANERAKPK